MRVAYLGLFSKIFDWVFARILAPVVQFVGGLLGTVLEWVFNTILMPLLTGVFKTVLPWIIDLLKELFCGLLYIILKSVCMIIEYLEEIFNIFSGAQEVTYTISKGNTITGQFLECMFYSPPIQKMYWTIFLAAFLLAGIFTIIAVMKSTIDLDFENKRPVGAVLRSTFKAIVTFLLLQLACFFIIELSGVVIKTIENGAAISMSSDGEKSSLGRIVFCLATMDAANDKDDNISSPAAAGKDIFTAGKRGEIYSGELDYTNKDEVEKSFKLAKFDFLTALVVAIFLAVVMATCAITFVQRVFEVLILFIVSPFFVATMPLDEGEKYKKWKELFIGKIFGGYGGVLSMKIFLMLVPVIMGAGIKWGDSDQSGTVLIKILFLCGGAYALTKTGPMITTLLNWQAGQAESATASAVGGFAGDAMKHVATKGIDKAKGLVKGAAAGVAGAFGADEESKEIADNKWDQMQKDGLSSEDREKMEKAEQARAAKEGGNASANSGKPDGLGGDASGAGSADGAGNASDAGNKPDIDGDNDISAPAPEAPDNRWGISKAFDSLMNTCHKVLPHKANADGSYSFGMLGFKVNYDKNGKRTGCSIPGLSFNLDHKGEYRLDKVSVPGIMTVERGGSGSMSITNIPAIGLRREEGVDGQMHTTDALGIFHQTTDMQGNYHVSNIAGIKFGQAYNTETGQYETSGVRIGNFIFGGNNGKK